MTTRVLDRPRQHLDTPRGLPEADVVFAAPALRRLLTAPCRQAVCPAPAPAAPQDQVAAVWVRPLLPRCRH